MDIWFTLFVASLSLAAATGGSLLLVAYLQVIPAAVSKSWRWAAVVILLPVLGPIWFSLRHWSECAKVGKQLIAGTALLLLAAGLLYGGGPYFVERVVAQQGKR